MRGDGSQRYTGEETPDARGLDMYSGGPNGLMGGTGGGAGMTPAPAGASGFGPKLKDWWYRSAENGSGLPICIGYWTGEPGGRGDI